MWHLDEQQHPFGSAVRNSEPCLGGSAAKLEPGEQVSVSVDTAPIRAAGSHDQNGYRHGSSPTQRPCDANGEPTFDVKQTERILYVGDDGLDLDDRERSGRGMPGEDVDPPAVAIAVEAHFRLGQPAAVAQSAQHHARNSRVVRVAQAGKLGATIAGVPAKSHAECCGDLPDRANRHALDLATLDASDQAGADPSTPRQVHLLPAAPVPQRSDRPAELDVLHGPSSRGVAYRRLTTGLLSARLVRVRPTCGRLVVDGAQADGRQALRVG